MCRHDSLLSLGAGCKKSPSSMEIVPIQGARLEGLNIQISTVFAAPPDFGTACMVARNSHRKTSTARVIRLHGALSKTQRQSPLLREVFKALIRTRSTMSDICVSLPSLILPKMHEVWFTAAPTGNWYRLVDVGAPASHWLYRYS